MTEVEPILRSIGAVAVIAGTILVVLQLRVNAKHLRSRNAFDLTAKVIDPSFPHRRHLLYEVADKHADGNWSGFDRSPQDFEVRNFANIYEQLGLLARKGVVDLQDVLDALSAQPMADWNTFQPIRAHIMQEAGKAFPPWRATSLGSKPSTGRTSGGLPRRAGSGRWNERQPAPGQDHRSLSVRRRSDVDSARCVVSPIRVERRRLTARPPIVCGPLVERVRHRSDSQRWYLRPLSA